MRLLGAAGVTALLLLPIMALSNYYIYLATLVTIYAIAVMGLGILFGMAGQLSLAQATFYGIGAYSAAVLSIRTELHPLVVLGIVVLLSILAGLVVGLPSLRVSGLRLAVVTLAFGELFTWWLVQNPDVTGGEQGLFVPSIVIGPINTFDPRTGYLFALAFGLVATAVARRLPRTATGRAMLAVRDSEAAARSVGVSLMKAKLVAFVIAGVFGGVSGWLFAHHVGAISPGFFGLFPSVFMLIAVILGGAGRAAGAWLGALYLVVVPEIFANVGGGNLYPLVGGAVLVIAILLAPDGLVGLPEKLWRHRLRSRTSRRGGA